MIYGDERIPDRVWAFVFPDPNTGCWLYAGDINHGGYALARIGGKTTRLARHVLKLKTGAEAPSTRHTCHVRDCVNPDHLVWGTHRENTRDMLAIGNHRNSRKTHCKYGHPFSGDNLVVRASGVRTCRACTNARARGYRAKQRGSRS